jgi:hypothetical protein
MPFVQGAVGKKPFSWLIFASPERSPGLLPVGGKGCSPLVDILTPRTMVRRKLIALLARSFHGWPRLVPAEPASGWSVLRERAFWPSYTDALSLESFDVVF